MRKIVRSLLIGAMFLMVLKQVRAEDEVKLLIPPDLGVVKFGDPVYLPVTIVNSSDEDAVVPSLFGGNPKMTIEARAIAPNSVTFKTMGEGGAHLTSVRPEI